MAIEHLERIVSEREAAAAHLLEILALPRARRERTLRLESRFHNYSFPIHALGNCEDEVSRGPAEAWQLARIARTVIPHIDPRTCGGAEALADLQAYSLALEGNTFRVHGDLRAALKSFSKARLLQRRGGTDLDFSATVDLLESS